MTFNEYKCNLDDLKVEIEKTIQAIERGEEPDNARKLIKDTPTGILLASPDHKERRYQPGNELTTYIMKDGNVVQETWGGGVAKIEENSVILRNENPLRFEPGFFRKLFKMKGRKVRGRYDEQGKFHTSRFGKVLFNEYVSHIDYVKSAFGVTPTTTRQVGFKQDATYAIKIPNIVITTGSGVKINLVPDDYALVQTKQGKGVISVHGIQKDELNRTYRDV